jgi:DNA polymerase-3 subunit alpha
MAITRTLPTVAQLGVDLRDDDAVWVRSAWCLEGDDAWRLRMLEVVAGSKPPGWEEMAWTYPSVSFFAQELPGEAVGDWLEQSKVTNDEGWEHALGQPTDRLNWERRESHAQSGYEVVEWQIITGWDYPSCENIGLLKMDFLGLRNLTVIGDAIDNIKTNRGEDIDLDRLGVDDPETYKMLGRGDTLGVFQLDGGPMRDLLRRMQPTLFADIVAVGALYRPGPMGMNAHNDYADRKNNKQKVTPIHPQLEEPLREILGDTYGLIVYQEQIMLIGQEVAGYSMGRADVLRRAMGKKKKEVLDQEYEGFHAGMRSSERIPGGFSDDAVKALWDTNLPFAGYAFNKSHAAAYGLISYWTAFLKANYTPEYMAALLTSVGDNKDKSAIYLSECRRLGIKVLPPDVNESTLCFAAVGNDIRFGMGAVRNVGANVVESIMKSREEKGRYSSFADFLASPSWWPATSG